MRSHSLHPAFKTRRSVSIIGLAALLCALIGWRAWAQTGATFVVNSLADVGDADLDDDICAADGGGCTLRAALQQAQRQQNHTILFDEVVFDGPRKTILLRGSLPVLGGTMRITAPEAGVVIDGDGRANGPIFTVAGGSSAIFTGLTITGGTSAAGGGAIDNLGTTLVDRCTLTDNAGNEGGAISSRTQNPSDVLTVRNSTISFNNADVRGGGLYIQSGRAVIESSTISSNSAPADLGGGIAAGADSDTSVEIRNSIVAGNLSSDVDTFERVQGNGANPFVSNGYNIIGDGNASATFNVGGDRTNIENPLLDTLRDNGGPTRTRALLSNSPAIDAGRAFDLTTDQRGTPFLRTYDDPLTGNASGSDGTDIGAFEVQPLPRGATTTFLNASPNPSVVGENVIFEAIITPADDGFPTGTVTFKIDGATVATRTLSGNSRTATYETTFSTAGNRTVTAEFAGTGAFADSDAIVEQQVDAAGGVTTLVVDTTSDANVGACSGTPGDCSLRGAINRANAAGGRQTINFNIPGGGVQTIAPATPLPNISGPVTIDGYTQPGSTPNTNASGAINATLTIVIDGSGAGEGANGLGFAEGSSGSIVRGLVIHSFGTGIVTNSSRNTVAGCFIGTNAEGTQTRALTGDGVRLSNSSQNTIGGTAAADRNLFAGNGFHAIDITGAESSGNTVIGNLIGVDKTATVALSGSVASDGVFIFNAPNNVISNNFIAGHGNAQTTSAGQGVVIAGAERGFSGAQNNVVRGNTIGIGALSNATDGIVVFRADNTQIGGANAGDGNRIAGNGDDGVQVVDSSGTVIAGNFIGTRDGTTADGNGDDGIVLQDGTTQTQIGGSTANERNTIVSNGDAGISIEDADTQNNQIRGNYIGLNAAGTGVLGNVGNGIIIVGAPNNTVGGSVAQRNVIAGNQSAGVGIIGTSASGNKITNNYLGLNANGLALPARSPDAGVFIVDAPGNSVGDVQSSTGNLIANHLSAGVVISGASAANNAVLNNTIGVDINGEATPNNGGVSFRNGAHDNRVGGSATTRNVITFNNGPGVSVLGDATDNNRISFNSLRANTGIGIDLGGDGPTANDTGDADSGPNQGQNKPVISSVTGLQIVAQLSSAPNATYRIEFFVTESRDVGNDVEGQTFLGTRDLTTDSNGNGEVTLAPPNGVPGARFITATAIDSVGNTSEFSLPAQAPAGPAPTEVNSLADDGPGSLRQAILFANNTEGRQTITFNFPPPVGAAGAKRDGTVVEQVRILSPSSPLPTITSPLTIDGFTQPGSRANTLETGSDAIVEVKIDGGGANFAGLTVDSGEFVTIGTVIRGVQISNFSTGIRLRSALNVVAGCVLTGNGDGVFIDGGRDNFIGKPTTFVGSVAEGEPSGNTTGDRNLISGNSGAGIRMASRPVFTAAGNGVYGCYIGTDAQGTMAFPNGSGIVIGTPRNRIGFRFLREGNLISGNSGDAITLIGDVGTNSGFNNTISGNLIGTAINGTTALGNGGDGIQIGGPGESSRNFIGGSGAGSDNLIANNGGDGIRIVNGTRNSLVRNRVFANNGLGINLVGGAGEDRNGVTPNDADDSDSGPNDLQNFPVITNVTLNGRDTRIQGTLQTTPGSYTLEFFTNPAADPSGANEGASFFTSESVTVPASGTFDFDITRSTFVLPAGTVITATATSSSSGNTSEFYNLVSTDESTFQFSAPTYSVNENGGNATITVTRAGFLGAAASVRLATSNGTATAGSDYSAVNVVLNFAAGQASATALIPITADTANEPNETVNLTLSEPSSGTTLGTPASAVLTIVNVNPPANAAPVAKDQSLSTPQNTPLSITLTATDSDTPVANLTFRVTTQPANGTLSGSGANRTYTPNPNFAGSDSFKFVANDGNSDSNIATITLQVTLAATAAPVAQNQNLSTPQNTPLMLALTATDADTPAANLTFRIAAQPQNGKLSGTAAQLVYTPNAGFSGTDTFTFIANDGTSDSNVGTITVQLPAPNVAPVANNQNLSTPVNTPLTFALTATDANNDALTFRIAAQPKNGKLSGNAAKLTYTPNTDFTGTDTFTFIANDGKADSNIGTITLQVLAAPVDNIPPVVTNQNLSTPQNTPLVLALKATDANNDALTFRIVSQPKNGKLSGSAAKLTYTPNDGFSGTDSFTFVANDGKADSNIGTITLQVLAANSPPIALNQSLRTPQNTPVTFALKANDADGDTLTFRIVVQPKNGKLSGSAAKLTYTPNDGFSGDDSFTFVANDGTVDSNLGTVALQVLAGNSGDNNAPVAFSAQMRVEKNGLLTITLRASDADNDALTYFVGQDLPGSTNPADKGILPRYGTLVGTAPSIVYKPRTDYVGRDVFTFYVSDGKAVSRQARIEIQVGTPPLIDAINDSYNLLLAPPERAQNVGVTLLDDGTFHIAARGVLANDRALPGKRLSARLARGPQHGRIQLNADGSFDYQPSSGFVGTDEFAYTLSDGQNTDTARVRLIVLDRRGPEQRFDAPLDGTTMKTVSAIRGRVRDRASGVKSMSLLWRRESDKAFWNGSEWTAAATPLSLTVEGTFWKYEGDLPEVGDDRVSDLLDGEYAMRATAIDNIGNTSRLIIHFTVDNAAPETPEFSEVRLSSAGASAEQGAIVLRFTGALDAESASDTMNYALAINGVEMEVGAADYTGNVVTLSGLDLNEGDEIELRVDGLRDTTGKVLHSGVIQLIAH